MCLSFTVDKTNSQIVSFLSMCPVHSVASELCPITFPSYLGLLLVLTALGHGLHGGACLDELIAFCQGVSHHYRLVSQWLDLFELNY